ncbi:tetratricopeptide repeat protein [uncultured Sphaerotilus sp.]|uniref:tetratricopeptide repeat protein n=1 Tax=uncultured Sphaerotilus sp. TaxID=474984 RepID=UPI0030CA41C8
MAGALTGLLMVPSPARAATDAPADRATLLAEGEAALAQGRVDQALRRFERAAALAHAPDTELALVRTYLQAGDYRQASAFSAHTAGAHRQVVEGAVLYAGLLAIGGQQQAAYRLLDEAGGRFPSSPMLAAVRRWIDTPGAAPETVLQPVRLAPYASGPATPRGGRVVASGVLIDQGRHALVPLEGLERLEALQVRNGLGQTADARIRRRDSALGLALLALTPALTSRSLPRALGDSAAERPLPAAAARDPFPGSPGYAVEFRPDAHARPAWPWLYSGFQGAVDARSGLRTLGVEMPAGPRGGPVLDAAGQWAGMAVHRSGVDRMLPVSALRAAFDPWMGAAATDTAPRPRAAVDEVYEGALRMTLQLIAVPRGAPR